jgi:hypothetical protein
VRREARRERDGPHEGLQVGYTRTTSAVTPRKHASKGVIDRRYH